MMQFAVSVGFALGIATLLATSGQGPKKSLLNKVTFSHSAAGKSSTLSEVLRELVSNLKTSNKSRIDRALFELSDLLDLIIVRLSAGEGIYSSISKVTKVANGIVPKLLAEILKAVEFGGSLASEIFRLPNSLPHPLISEFANKISTAQIRGTPIAEMLSDLSQSIRAELRNRLLRQAGRNETRMLFPLIFLILPITVLFAIYPSLRLLSLGFL